MRKKFLLLTATVVLLLMPMFLTVKTFAGSCGGAETNLISCDDGDGSGTTGICHILNLVVRIMTTGIGILAVLGTIFVGIQYLTAGDSEEKLRKSKHRLLELIIGVVIYVLMGSFIQFLLPGGNFCGVNTPGGDSSKNNNGQNSQYNEKEGSSSENNDNEEYRKKSESESESENN